MRSNIISNEHNKKIILSISRRDEINCYLVSVSVDKPHEDLVRHKGISFSGPKKTVDLTATFNSELFSMDANYEKDKNYQLSTNDDEK